MHATATARAHEAIVEGLDFEPVLHFQLQCAAPLHVEIASRRRAPLYVVGQGGARLRWEDAPPVTLHAGDVAFLPRAGRHRLCSDERAPLQRFEDLLAHVPQRQGRTFGLSVAAPADTAPPQLWSGSFYWRADLAAHPMLAALPPVLVLRQAQAPAWLPSMGQLVGWMADIHAGGRGVGLSSTMNALMQHLVLDWLRGDAPPVPAGASRAPRDARLLPALHAIHTRPAHPWTTTELARLCHLSRVPFAQRFRAQMQLPPMRYLARWRIHLAERLFREQRLTLQQAADRVGYSTGAILARAYKRERGVAPTAGGTPEQRAANSS